MRTLRIASLLVAACGLAACPPSAPVESTTTINLDSTVFPLGAPKDTVDERFTFFAGTTVDHFSIALSVTGLSSAMKLEVRPGDGGTPVQTFTSGGSLTAQFPGNVGVLRFVSDGLTTPPGMSLTSMSLHSTGAPVIPAVTSSLTGQVTAMPLTLNRPVEIGFPAAPTPKTYFMAVTGVGGKTLDIVVDGPGRVSFNTDAAAGFVLPEAGGGEPGGFTSATGGMTTIVMNPTRDTLLLTVDSVGVERLTRVSVNEPTNVLSLRARFMSPVAITTAELASVTAAFVGTSSRLYQATMGHVRIGSLTMLASETAAAGSAAPDVYVLPPSRPGGLLPALPLPDHAVVFDMGLPTTRPATDPSALAVSLLNALFALPVEPPDANGSLTCPNSLMSAGSGMMIPTLCWRGNHNPFGSSALGAAAPSAAWDILAARVGLAAPPSASPAHVLRTLSGVTFPIATTLVR